MPHPHTIHATFYVLRPTSKCLVQGAGIAVLKRGDTITQVVQKGYLFFLNSVSKLGGGTRAGSAPI